MEYDAVCADMDGQLHPDVKTEQRQPPVRQNKGGTMKKESNRNRTRRTAVALALLLSFAAPQALRGNLGIYAPTCGGCVTPGKAVASSAIIRTPGHSVRTLWLRV